MIPGVGLMLVAFATGGGPSPPVVSAISPALGDTAGGIAVSITVDDSTGATGASIGGVALTSFSIVDATHVSGVTGAHAATTAADVQVTNGGGTGTLAGGFEYWNPSVPATPNLWLDATRQIASGSWLDQSGHAVDFAGTCGVGSGINGKATATFDGSQALTGPSIAAWGVGHVFAIIKNGSGVPQAAFTLGSGPAGWHPFSDGFWYDNTGTTTRYNTATAPAGIGAGSAYRYECQATSTWDAWIDDVHILTSATNTTGWSATPRLGTNGIGNLTGEMGEIVVYGSILSAADQAKMKTYLQGKWGI